MTYEQLLKNLIILLEMDEYPESLMPVLKAYIFHMAGIEQPSYEYPEDDLAQAIAEIARRGGVVEEAD